MDYSELEDFRNVIRVGHSGTNQHFRMDWFTPDGISTLGDGKRFDLYTGTSQPDERSAVPTGMRSVRIDIVL